MTNLLSPGHAAALDAADPLRTFRDEFLIPRHDGHEQAYFCGNSLGLQPRGVRAHVEEVLDKWAAEAVEGHFTGQAQWMPYHELVREPLAHLVGAKAQEVVAMNSLTANLHLMMVSFYQPTIERTAILIEAGSFPSDRYAVESQLRFHGLPPDATLIEVEPDLPNGVFSMQRIEQAIRDNAQRLCMILWPGVQYRSGQAFDLARIAALGHEAGAIVGFDLAHAVGNLPLQLHDWNADFAVWCHYKYLNSGPGAVAGCFVHERHAATQRPRFAGWWGNDASVRFRMGPQFQPTPGADGWQLSNPPILGLAPLRAASEQFLRAGMPALREKSLRLTTYLGQLVDAHLADAIEIVTPRDDAQHGSQFSLRVKAGRDGGRALFEHLATQGVIGDWREPDVIRISPAPLYNNFEDVRRFALAAIDWMKAR
ncbi:kynureninase [Solilutibacter silvestris]|uniref:Kynureninase n=1 Tax=Solilutibacter silvestris TaxID=1645665 RepID=A0A2K1PYR5_9GAMM|nr:kynureninase [Lysobacter silvestris]PNS07919.1 kynureninase [Lysobacter silvestris]